jgi:hypothetical protein
MTGFQLTRPQSTTWAAERDADSVGRHACQERATLTLRRMFYFARHLGR